MVPGEHMSVVPLINSSCFLFNTELLWNGNFNQITNYPRKNMKIKRNMDGKQLKITDQFTNFLLLFFIEYESQSQLDIPSKFKSEINLGIAFFSNWYSLYFCQWKIYWEWFPFINKILITFPFIKHNLPCFVTKFPSESQSIITRFSRIDVTGLQIINQNESIILLCYMLHVTCCFSHINKIYWERQL